MRTLQQILAAKQRPLVKVGPTETVFQALTLMATHNTGAVLVQDEGKLVGILTERDVVRKLDLQGRSSRDTEVRAIMSSHLVCTSCERSVDDCMAIMSERRIRHLPVVDANEELLGLVSIGDLVMETIREKDFLIEQLELYIKS